MLKDITIGQFFPGNSLLHRLDPRMKIILTVLYIVLLFVARNIASFLAVMLFSLILIAISRISPKLIFKSWKQKWGLMNGCIFLHTGNVSFLCLFRLQAHWLLTIRHSFIH